ncbi:ribosomal protein S18 [Phlyctochytrium arcticum]|nr:ribosomal protein S18 [Phlyctochytrium arcticum]
MLLKRIPTLTTTKAFAPKVSVQKLASASISEYTKNLGIRGTKFANLKELTDDTKQRYKNERGSEQAVRYTPIPVRQFYPRETYSPVDLNNEYVPRWLKRRGKQPVEDICAKLRINPLDRYKDVTFLSQFLTQMGYIKPHDQTGLSLTNQRKLAKAVKRARAVGLLPTTYRLPTNNDRF